MTAPLRAPFPWFGGKSRARHLVWEAFGDVPNYVEPFAGSLAVLLGRPTEPRIETVNDLDCYLANFWRAVQAAPERVAKYADWPVNEADLHARHRWLVGRAEFRKKMRQNPRFFDAKIAGFWVWGQSQWIGSGWCCQPGWEGRSNAGRAPRGVNAARMQDLRGNPEYERRPSLSCRNGVHQVAARGPSTAEHRQRPDLSGHRGVTAPRLRAVREQLPDLSGDSGAAGRGVHAVGVRKLPLKRPNIGGSTGGRHGVQSGGGIYQWMDALQQRLRYVRVCCGDWRRILGPSVTEKIGVTGIMLDPPYGADAGRDPSIYAEEDLGVAARVRQWALENGDNPKLRIALCGYEGEHEMPASWQCVPWKASGGYAAAAGNTENAHRERIWFSPACNRVGATKLSQQEMFAGVAGV